MKARKEIEEYLQNLGIEIQSHMEERNSTEYGSEVFQTERFMPITGERIVEDNLKRDKIKVLNEDAKNALLDLISQSITNGDMETAKISLEVLQDESGFYKGHRDAAIRSDIPLDKRIAFDKYCQSKIENKQFAGSMATFMASARNVSITRKSEQVNGTIAEIKSATLEKESDKEIE